MTMKRVSFNEITIYEHPLELGDNPACSIGAPLTIGWKAQAQTTRHVEMHEYMRGPRRRGRSELAIDVQDRSRILLSIGCSLAEITDATRAAETTKRQRAESLKSSSLGRAASLMEMTGKIPKDILNGLARHLIKPIRNTLQARSA